MWKKFNIWLTLKKNHVENVVSSKFKFKRGKCTKVSKRLKKIF